MEQFNGRITSPLTPGTNTGEVTTANAPTVTSTIATKLKRPV